MIVIKLFFRNWPLTQEMEVSRRVGNCLSSLSGVLCHSRKLTSIPKFICLPAAAVRKRFASTLSEWELQGEELCYYTNQAYSLISLVVLNLLFGKFLLVIFPG